mmetsp:Transcript_76503/g.138042  ORF Transcript_76503/g.138042 Transcript_76503/m.138042 type:complete len:90 (-) Transcript_76503:142-411(-)
MSPPPPWAAASDAAEFAVPPKTPAGRASKRPIRLELSESEGLSRRPRARREQRDSGTWWGLKVQTRATLLRAIQSRSSVAEEEDDDETP